MPLYRCTQLVRRTNRELLREQDSCITCREATKSVHRLRDKGVQADRSQRYLVMRQVILARQTQDPSRS